MDLINITMDLKKKFFNETTQKHILFDDINIFYKVWW